MKNKTEAQKEHASRLADIQVILKSINTELADHKKKMAAQPQNWGLAGDLGHIRNNLAGVLGFLRNCEGADILQNLKAK